MRSIFGSNSFNRATLDERTSETTRRRWRGMMMFSEIGSSIAAANGSDEIIHKEMR
jgi:hypothetical protein